MASGAHQRGDYFCSVNDERYVIDPENPAAPLDINVVMVRKNTDDAASIGIEGKGLTCGKISRSSGVIDDAQNYSQRRNGWRSQWIWRLQPLFQQGNRDGENIAFAEIGSTLCAIALRP